MALWQPSNLGTSKCIQYWDAQNSGSLSLSGSTVLQINDLSGNNRHLTAPGGLETAYLATGMNSRPTLNFATTKVVRSVGTGFGTTNSFGVAVVAQQNPGFGTGSPRLVSLSTAALTDTGGSGTAAALLVKGTIRALASNSLGNGWIPTGADTLGGLYAASTPFVALSYFSGTAYVLRVNGTATRSNTITAITLTSNINVFYGSTETANAINAFNGYISSGVLFSNVSPSEIEQLEAYLHWQYDLQGNLPVDHPYKSAPPEAPNEPSGALLNQEAGLIRPFFTPFIARLF